MMKSPDLGDLRAAELRFIAAKQRTVDGGRRTWESMKSALARPSSLAVVAAAGFCGGLLAGRPSRRGPAGDESSPETQSFAGLGLAFALRYGLRLAPVILSRMREEQRKAEPCPVVKTTVIRDGDIATPAE
jgi:hypothetical protein